MVADDGERACFQKQDITTAQKIRSVFCLKIRDQDRSAEQKLGEGAMMNSCSTNRFDSVIDLPQCCLIVVALYHPTSADAPRRAFKFFQ